MSLFKKSVAVIFMVLSVIAVIALIIGLFGSWSVKARVETTALSLLLTGENVVTVTRDGLARVDELLETSSSVVTDVDNRIRELGAGLENSEIFLDRIRESTDNELVNAVESAVTTFNQIEANIVAINDAVEAFRAIPMLPVSIDSRLSSISKLQEVEDMMTGLRENVARLSQLLQARRSELIQGRVSAVTDVTGGLRSNLRTTQATLQETDLRLVESAETMAALRERLPRLLTTITILLNVIFLLAILAFISLFLHAWEYFKCPEDGLGGLLPGDCEKAAAEI